MPEASQTINPDYIDIDWEGTNPHSFKTSYVGWDKDENRYAMPPGKEFVTVTTIKGERGCGATPEEALKDAKSKNLPLVFSTLKNNNHM